ncbi:MAG: galactokinase [Isosphaeraceae bacterium]
MPLTTLEHQAVESFTKTFNDAPTVLGRAPGRVELLGNHTDHNGGLVLATAIDRYTAVAGRRCAERSVMFRSVNFGTLQTFDMDAIEPGQPGDWGAYVRGVAWALREARGVFLGGVKGTILGDVPLGAGLSSSASLQAALALFLLHAGVVPGGLTRVDLEDQARLVLARVLQRSENAFVGVASGLLDQFTVLFGRAGHAIMLDCRSLDFSRLPLGDPAPSIVVCDSGTSRRLADGMYNRRRAECESVVAYFQARKGAESVRSLRDVSLEEVVDSWDALDSIGRLRARHVLNENARVRDGAEALRRGDLARFGQLMSASHASSRDDFANSAPALDALIESAERSPGFLGGKLSGAGWAGCTVNLVEADRSAEFAESVADAYRRRTGNPPIVHVCRAAEGASGITLDHGTEPH